MAASALQKVWDGLSPSAESAGLNLCWVLPREQVEGWFSGLSAPAVRGPIELYPEYRSAVVLGSAGTAFWDRFHLWNAFPPQAAPDPLDCFTEQTAEALLEPLREHDPAATAAYPFRHPRQIVPFLAFCAGSALLEFAPFGVAVHPTFGPWFAFRAVLLTSLPFRATPLPTANPCSDCGAPCVEACPAGAVKKGGFRWEVCAGFRVAESACRDTCLSRNACPVGRDWKYGRQQMAFHSAASLKEIRAMGKVGSKIP